MPELDGIETCQRIRNIPELSDTIIAKLSYESIHKEDHFGEHSFVDAAHLGRFL